MTSGLIHFLLALPVLLLFVVFGIGQVTITILGLPLVIVVQFMLTLSLAYPLAAFHVRFRDTQYLLGIVLNMLFFLTPIFYDTSFVPERYQAIYRLNPMLHLIEAYRAILIQGQWPNLWSILVLAVFSVGLLAFGYIVFMRTSYRFVEEL